MLRPGADVQAFTVLILKIAFLTILWLFIVVIAAVVNADMVGRRQKKSSRKTVEGPQPDVRPPATQPHKRRKEPWVLAIDSGLHAGDRLQLVPEVRIGRAETCELVLDDDYVSSTHALLSHRDDGTWVLKDLGSTNGTYVNSQRIADPTIVSVDDTIRIGDVQMRLET